MTRLSVQSDRQKPPAKQWPLMAVMVYIGNVRRRASSLRSSQMWRVSALRFRDKSSCGEPD